MSASRLPKNFFKILVNPGSPNIDIVAVHGLNSMNTEFHAESTWMAEGKLWLKDFLPFKLPNARVLLFGYNSNVAFETSIAGVREQAVNLLNRLASKREDAEERPIIFVAHSLGGIIVKWALVEAKLDDNYKAIRDATYGIAFFGTPHQGGNFAKLGDIAASIVRVVLHNPKNTFMEALKKDSLFSDNLVDDFRHQLEDYHVLSFYETLQMGNLGLIVDKKSTTLGLADVLSHQILPKSEATQNISTLSDCVHGGPGDGYDISEFFRTADHGSILITSRMQSLTELGKSFPIQKLEYEDAIQLLLQRSGLPVPDLIRIEAIDNDIITLMGHLGGLPLAIVIAGTYIRETGTSIREYLQHYQESWHNLQSESRPERHYQHGNILQTWLISYNEIKKRDLDAAKLMLLLARFDNRDIWYELVECGIHSLNQPTWFQRVISNSLIFKKTMRTLIGFSLIEANQQNGSYMMHPVVQDWCLHITDKEHNVKAIQLHELALISVGYMVSSNHELNYWDLQQRLLAHASYVLKKWNSDLRTSDIDIRGAFYGIGNLYVNQGKLNEAEDMYQRALAGHENALGSDHLRTLNNLGVLYFDQGKLEKAEEIYQSVLVGHKKILDPDHAFALDAINNLGNVYFSQAKLKEAEEMYQQVLVGHRKIQGLNHISLLRTLNNLGIVYFDQGKLEKAEEMYQRALKGYEKSLDPDHKFTLDVINNLGNLYFNQGNLKEAESMYQRVLTCYKKVLDPDHISVLRAFNNLGNVYVNQRKLKEAEEMYQQALTGYEKTLSLDHINALHIVNNLGILYLNQGKLEEAKMMYQRAVAHREKILGMDHTSTLDSICCLGILYLNQGKLKEAEEKYRRALAGYEKVLGLNHPKSQEVAKQLNMLINSKRH
ncbi:uncharacterized protein TRUGW13939_07623 [Talaromyces rugulosus]|uniref:DUF676 domain-containing protein n=1 Tax=Talaromyces rugulosus TaxID=121627 RepID=A0A7H8R375_TALRU|nr:uncharacterized protein TRUGW13939_07623 [Talaromyces rugulosus]QKX60478.1 hypothetical protein TRUGW13939_07623 [Talaromyces rugulosus]